MKKKVVTDPLGLEVDISSSPVCRGYPDCFASVNGLCTILSRADVPCSFYKSTSEYEFQNRRRYKQLKENGKKDLLRKYRKPYAVLGLFEEDIINDIMEGEDPARYFDKCCEEDYQEQLQKAMDRSEQDDLLDEFD